MRRVDGDYMARLLVAFRRGTSTVLDQKRVCCKTSQSVISLLIQYKGWAPQTFVSSRSDRAKKQAARPEDFMDEEDLQDLKDSRNLVDVTEEMDFLGGTQAELRGNADEDIDKELVANSLLVTLNLNFMPAVTLLAHLKHHYCLLPRIQWGPEY